MGATKDSARQIADNVSALVSALRINQSMTVKEATALGFAPVDIIAESIGRSYSQTARIMRDACKNGKADTVKVQAKGTLQNWYRAKQ